MMDKKVSEIHALPKRLVASNAVLLLLCFLGGIVYAFVKGLYVKIPVSSCFLVLGCINAIFAGKHLHTRRGIVWALFAGLLFGFLADIVLELDFLMGAAVFALGHVFYVIAYCLICPLGKKDLLPCTLLLLFIVSLILFAPFLDFGGSLMKGIVLAYGVIISLMLGKALGNFRRQSNVFTKILLVGSALFFFSDLMLLLESFAGAGRIANILCIFTYYPGQALLAHAICREP